jgi:large subunit ribosomal protein L6
MVKVEKRVSIPDDVEISFDGSVVVVKGPKGEVRKTMEYPGVTIKKDQSEIVIEAEIPKSDSGRLWALTRPTQRT